MATTTDELTYVNFPIFKTEETPEGLLVYGKATDGSVDSDDQIVDPEWSGKALSEWLQTGGNLRVQHNAHRDPAGRGVQVDIDKDGDGAHWVKSLVVEPVAKDLVRNKVLTAYSVGIMRPRIITDTKARGGKIVSGELGELSLVDRPANRNCRIELVKADKDGAPLYSGEVLGDPDQAATQTTGPVTKDDGAPDVSEDGSHDPWTGTHSHHHQAFGAQGGDDHHDHSHGHTGDSDHDHRHAGKPETKTTDGAAPSPADVAKVIYKRQHTDDSSMGAGDLEVTGRGIYADSVVDRLAAALKSTSAGTQKRDMDPNVGGGVDRDKIPAEDFAGKDRSFPIVTPKDVSDAASSIGRASPGNYSSDKLKANIIAIAHRKGAAFVAQLPNSWQADDTTKTAPSTGKVEACPTCGGDGKIRDGNLQCPDCKGSGKATEATADTTKTDSAACAGCGSPMAKSHKFCPKCGTAAGETTKSGTPADSTRDHHTDPVPAHREPDGPQTEIFEEDAGLEDGDEKTEGDSEPTPTWQDEPRGARSTKTVDYETARLHDALCAAYSPDTIADTYPALKSVAGAVSVKAWQDQAMALVASGDLTEAEHMLRVASAAKTLTVTHHAAVADARASLHKSFTDAYPDTHLTPAEVTPGRFQRPYLDAGHPPLSAEAAGDGPPTPITHEVNAGDFERPYLTDGHATPSPGAEKDNSPSHGGPPAYGAAQVAVARNAMTALHDHVAGAHIDLCPMAPTGTPNTVGGTSHVIDPVSKTTEPDTTKNAAAVTLETVQKMLADSDTRHTEALTERDATIADLRKQIDALAAEPDPRLAPLRGIIATKQTTSGGAGPVERRSLVDEAIHQEMRTGKLGYLATLVKSGNPGIREPASDEYERELARIRNLHEPDERATEVHKNDGNTRSAG